MYDGQVSEQVYDLLLEFIPLVERVKYILLQKTLSQGITFRQLGKRAGYSQRQVRKFLLTNVDMNLRQVSNLFFGLNEKISLKFLDKRNRKRYFDGTGEHLTD